ncbi:hypothetical protein [Bdellovibrio svalbardensis]|uniref:Outer membrane protein beta-barrel domain-containing protein n=1 Tax=Bdellovibrio svalbardensis TaxID=2972972 RepID=A0ABT6DL29_9BACT|nr:hypothetical protein [Bdellovibrio svalbardensis]MDG0817572.1 hypothetical protein [Bdellovibrio svalbardensis]
MLNYRLALAACLFFAISSNIAYAKEIPVQGRLFAGSTSIDPKNVNETIEAQGLQKIDTAMQLGIEITYPLLKYLDVGLRYTKRNAEKDEQPSNASTDYSAKIEQDAMLLVARVPIVKSDFVRLDVFGGVGGSNTTFTLKSASQNGELTRKEAEGWFATPYTAVGASVAFGYKQFYVVFEGGVETNKVDGFKRSGTVSSSLDTVDLSGSYFTVGLMFDGVPGSIK